MDSRIGAFFQKAVDKTFGRPHLTINGDQSPSIFSQPDAVIGCLPESPNSNELRRHRENSIDVDADEYACKRSCHPQNSDSNELGASQHTLQGTDPEQIDEAASCVEQYGSQHSPLIVEDSYNFPSSPDRESFQSARHLEDCEGYENDEMFPDTLMQNSPFIDGPSEIITVNHSGKDCLAMVVTDDMVGTFNEIKEANDYIARTSKKLRVIEKGIRDLSYEIEMTEERLNSAEDEQIVGDIKVELEDLRLKLEKNQQRKEKIRKQTRPYESNLQYSAKQFQTILEEVLQTAAPILPKRRSLEENPEADDDSVGHSEQTSAAASDTQSQSSSCEGAPPSPVELLRRSASEELEESMLLFMAAEAQFEDRHEYYKRELAAYNECTANGESVCGRTDFDLHLIEYVAGLTEELIEIEHRYEVAKAQAEALGLPIDRRDDNNFDDGYRESQEATMVNNIDRGRIEAWKSRVAPVEDGEGDSCSADIDDWNHKPVDTTDSHSVVDFQGYAKDIKVWQEHCEALREQSQSEDT